MNYPSEDYYSVLALPVSATQEDIKSQYKQLVRTYHPDRFMDPDEKAVAEDRFKLINEAYRVLSSRAVEGQLVKYMQRELGLTVVPELLDFGLLERRTQQRATFHVHFEKDVEAVDFIPSEEESWFRVSKVSHIYGDDHASLEFEVEVDSTGLAAQTYQGWIDLYLDTTMTRVPLSMQVAQGDDSLLSALRSRLSHTYVPRRWALALTFVLAVLIFTTAFTFINTRSFTQAQGPAGAGRSASYQANQLYFSLLDQGVPSVYTALSQQAALPSLLTDGTAAAVTTDGQQVAFLAQQMAATQIFLRDQTHDQAIQLTTDSAPKSQLAWSTDGRQLAYLVGDGQASRIGVYDIAQAQEYRLPGEVTTGVSNFSWSPAGSTLLFDLWQNGERRVYHMAAPDGELEQLTQFDSWAGTWSPDANEVIVASPQGLYRLDRSGRNLRQISNMPADQPKWSTTGEWLAYTTRSLNQPSNDTGSSKRGKGESLAAEVTEPATGVAYTLWLMQLDGTDLRQVAQNSLWHAWSPTGEILGYITGTEADTDAAKGLEKPEDAPLFYLWTVTPEGAPQLVAEVNEPFFSWSQ